VSGSKSALAQCNFTVHETTTRDAIKDGRRTIAYVAIGAEQWGPMLAASPAMFNAIDLFLRNIEIARQNSTHPLKAQTTLANIDNWPGVVALRAAIEQVQS
jgi:hypothetical protein